MLLTPLAFAPAQIRHRRFLPKAHHFEAKLTYLWFDPDQIEKKSKSCLFWSTSRWNLLKITASDFLRMYSGSIREKVKKAVLQHANTFIASHWQIRVMALPRCLGFRFNSVVFYFVLDEHGKLQFILSEITNTPWNERTVYVHDCREALQIIGDYQSFEFDFDKAFHVSPFMPMQLGYCWKFSFSESQNIIHMQLYQQHALMFDATMRFHLEPITFPSQQYRYAFQYSMEPIKMLFSIYVQAFRLWQKKIPFYRHPKKNKDA
ncbi:MULTISPECIES: DUF1365 domain-containing protein [Acinetobacter]|nr:MULTISPECIES: DUF1365 domain-containing protein [Acinetobacter]ENV54386.1 hypothetical protein F952_01065 [Acinetobacter baylyi DSM 14961 = CIP 107474]KAF2372546.1 hypothetical protein BSL88_02615 [Acinetobacter baylyi]KAF2374037.1 hypothetical protein BSL67_08070 [Acinetobacter baylyi]KAF2378051.1 hypothetical protein BSN81_05910 [Acinetobacter baylyi]KAF2380514.1 hypothetical protein BSN83_10765 [Acinetobacter baylyi]